MTQLRTIVRSALAEDVGAGDITSALTVDAQAQGVFLFVAREPMRVSGLDVGRLTFAEVDMKANFAPQLTDGDEAAAGQVLARVNGLVRSVLTAERTTLNLMQRMCGVATLTARYVTAIEGTGAQILDTRKTMPGLRVLDKYAVRCGGGRNHRMRLDDAILIKDNHIAMAGSLTQALTSAIAGAPEGMGIEVECDTLAQVAEAIAHGATMLLLDNMSLEQLREAVGMAKPKGVITEASGGVTLETVRAIAQTGVDYISVGRLTHSAPAVDIGLDAA